MTTTWATLIIEMILTGVSVTILLRRLISPKAGYAPSGATKSVYLDQLAQLDHDVAAGEIREDEVKSARTEIARRLLSAAAEVTPPPQYRPLRRICQGIAFLLPMTTAAIYLYNGSPTLPSQPFAGRDQTSRIVFATISAEADVLRRRLATAPQDRASWIQLGSLSRLIGDAKGAVNAYGHAISIQPTDPVLQNLYGEALVVSSDGTVTQAARDAFELALSLKPGDLTARYYLAMASSQEGDDRLALQLWRALIEEAPTDAPWLASAHNFLAETTRRLQQSLTPRSQ